MAVAVNHTIHQMSHFGSWKLETAIALRLVSLRLVSFRLGQIFCCIHPCDVGLTTRGSEYVTWVLYLGTYLGTWFTRRFSGKKEMKVDM